MTAAARPGFPLGIGVPPADGDELARRVAATLQEGTGGLRIERLAGSAVSAVVSGFDVVELEVDVTGAHITTSRSDDDAVAGEGSDGVGEAGATRGVTVGRGVAHRIRVQGAPVMFADAPVAVDVDIAAVPIRWVRRTDDVLELSDELDSPESDGPRGHARLSIAPDAVPLLVEGLVRDATGPELGMRDAALTLADAGLDAVSFEGEAHISIAGLGARVRLSGTVHVVDGTQLRVEGFDVRSRNLLAAAALAAVRSRITEATSQEFDLSTALPVGLARARVGIASPDGGLELAATFD